MSVAFYTNEEIIRAARRRLAQGPWDYLAGGTESETSLRRNRLAFDRLALAPPGAGGCLHRGQPPFPDAFPPRHL